MIRSRSVLIGIVLVAIAAFIGGILFTRWQRLPLHQAITVSSNQNIYHYINPKTQNQRLISKRSQAGLVKDFLTQYFSPWAHLSSALKIKLIQAAKSDIEQSARAVTLKPGFGMNFHRYSQHWANNVTANTHMSAFPANLKSGIILYNTSVRMAPTHSPWYGNPHHAGQGYPFDAIQSGALWAGTPLRVIQRSKDGAWVFVETISDSGWVSSRAIGLVNNKLANQYRSGKYITIIEDNVAVKDSHHHFLFMSRIGSIFPIINGKIMAVEMGDNHYAKLTEIKLPKSSYRQFPLKPSSANFALLISRMLGEPYGWGGLNQWRDCALTLRSLFADFGLALPVSSTLQSEFGKKIDVSGMSNKAKLSVIKRHGIPFLTLIGLKGHIMLYIGMQGKHAYVFHNKWGLHTENVFHDKGRAIIGSASITTLKFGQHVPFVKSSLLDEATSVTRLNN